jgi:hypothetical protein
MRKFKCADCAPKGCPTNGQCAAFGKAPAIETPPQVPMETPMEVVEPAPYKEPAPEPAPERRSEEPPRFFGRKRDK